MVELSCYLSKFKRKKAPIAQSHLLLTYSYWRIIIEKI